MKQGLGGSSQPYQNDLEKERYTMGRLSFSFDAARSLFMEKPSVRIPPSAVREFLWSSRCARLKYARKMKLAKDSLADRCLTL